MAPIYLDHAATTPVRAEVLEAMLPYYGPRFGNPSSMHRWGRDARTALDEARERVAHCLGASADEICFTSCGTEADNIAVLGAWRAGRDRGRNAIVTTPIEHKAVLGSVHQAAREGADERFCRMTPDGVVDVDAFRALVNGETAIASVMWVNNEIGTVQPIAELGAHAQSVGALFHTDAVQAFGKIAIDTKTLPADVLSISGHKIGAPKGIGAVYLRRGTLVEPLFFGGAQDRGRRPGTENVAYAVGFARAAELAVAERDDECARVERLRTRLEAAILARIPDAVIHGRNAPHRAPHILNVSVPGTDSESMLMALDLREIGCSAGSACQSGSITPSHVLSAIGVPPELALAAIRMSLGCLTTDACIDRVIEVFPALADKARGLARELTMFAPDTPRPGERVLVAMSGGVDSSVAAALLVDQGYDVIGATMKLFCHDDGDLPDRPCCSLDSVNDARRVCQALGVPHYVLNMEQAFGRDVVDDFVREYDRGRTPIPCVRCNTFTKFRDLVVKADAIDARWVATGHYARVAGGVLHRGLDPAKDQSYFLWGVDRAVLARLLLPVGAQTKAETRAVARHLSLSVVAEKTESQDICFVPDGDHTKIIRKRLGADAPSLRPGPIVRSDGTRLGTHDGFAYFTIGQRRGLPGGFREPMYVVEIRPEEHAVVIGPRSELLGRGVVAREVNWLVDAPAVGARVSIQVRHRAPAAAAELVRSGDGEIELALDEPVAAITPGQSIVLYDGARVLGGGVIESARGARSLPVRAA